MTRYCTILLRPALALALLFTSAPGLAADGNSAPPDPPPDGTTTTETLALRAVEPSSSASGTSYYQEVLQQSSSARAALESSDAGGLPASLYVVSAQGAVVYRSGGDGAWTVTVKLGERPQEQVDTVYDMVLALPLPVSAQTKSWRIPVRTGEPSRSVPAIYAGEKIALKRNSSLETSWLPVLLARSELPNLSDSGYRWTLWDTIVRYDPSAGPTIQGFGSLDYEADPGVGAPDPDDPRNAAYLITWVPTLDASVPPYTLQLDVVAPN